MRTYILCLVLVAALLLTGCPGKKKMDPNPEVEVTDMSRTQYQPREVEDTEMTEEDLTRDTAVDFGSEEPVSERPIADMTLEEINAAEFLKNIFFEFDKFDLTDQALEELETNGRWLLANATVKVIIEGHCDERGTEEYNLALGERRANSARDFLVRLGIDPDRLMTASYGESRPLDPRSSESAWGRNRRAHFRIYAR